MCHYNAEVKFCRCSGETPYLYKSQETLFATSLDSKNLSQLCSLSSPYKEIRYRAGWVMKRAVLNLFLPEHCEFEIHRLPAEVVKTDILRILIICHVGVSK